MYTIEISLGKGELVFFEALNIIEREHVAERIWEKDYTLWSSELKSLEFEISYHKNLIGINITPGGIRLRSRPSREAPVNIGFGDRIFQLGPGQTLELAP